ncbi:hypothetical protein BDW69DRAFT_172426 [Aspergillus filifer]
MRFLVSLWGAVISGMSSSMISPVLLTVLFQVWTVEGRWGAVSEWTVSVDSGER